MNTTIFDEWFNIESCTEKSGSFFEFVGETKIRIGNVEVGTYCILQVDLQTSLIELRQYSKLSTVLWRGTAKLVLNDHHVTPNSAA